MVYDRERHDHLVLRFIRQELVGYMVMQSHEVLNDQRGLYRCQKSKTFTTHALKRAIVPPQVASTAEDSPQGA